MTIFTDKVQKYNTRLMKDLNITKVQACGIWGNIGGETGGFTALQEIKPTVAGSKGGYGWLQWTGPRRRKYEAWCAAQHLDLASDEANYQYLVHETLTDEAHSLIQLRKTTTLEVATETFMKQNLRPGIPNLQGRIVWAHKAWDATNAPSQNAGLGTTAVIAAGGAAAATQASPDHVWYWVAAAAIAAALAGIGVLWYKHSQPQPLPPQPVATLIKRKKRNVSSKK